MTTVSLPYSSYKRGKSTCAELVKFVNLHSTVGSLQFCVQSGNMYMLMRIPVFLADQAGLKPVKQPILVERAVYGCKKGEGFTVLKKAVYCSIARWSKLYSSSVSIPYLKLSALVPNYIILRLKAYQAQ